MIEKKSIFTQVTWYQGLIFLAVIYLYISVLLTQSPKIVRTSRITLIKAKEDADAKKKAAAEKAEVVRQYQDKLDSLRKTDFGSKLFEGMTAETLMTKYSGDIEDFVNERMEKMKMDRREAQEKIRKQERSFDYNERAKVNFFEESKMFGSCNQEDQQCFVPLWR